MERRLLPLSTELEELERELAALTLRVAALRNRNNTDPARRVPSVGARVRFFIANQGYTEGVIIGITPQRLRVRQDTTNHQFLRAPHNVTLL